MNKKLMALALAGVVVAPAAMAQSANPVTLYGRVYVTFENVKADGGAGVPSRNRVSNQASYIGFRGTEDLGGGLKAFFQLESGSTPDTGATVTCTAVPCSATAINGTFGSRNSAVGLQGGFGSILLGKWDTPFKVTTTTVDPFGDLLLPGTTAAMNDRGNFDLRPNNTVQYWSPDMGGFSVRAHYSANENKTATANPTIVGLSGTFSRGPIFAGVAYEKHKDRTGGEPTAVPSTVIANFEEKGQAAFGAFTFGPVKLGVLIEKFTKTGATDQKADEFNITYTAGNNQFIYQYQHAKDGGASTAAIQPDCKMNGIGYFYNFTKRTSFVAHYASVKNNDTAACNFGANTLGIAAGQDPKGGAVGFRHVF